MRLRLAASALMLLAAWSGPVSAAAPPQRVASVFLCTDEYVFRLLPRARIAALSFLSADRHPVVSTIADQVRGIALIPMSAEAVLSAKPDLVVMAAGTSAGVRNVLRAAKIPIVDVPWPETLADIRRITRGLARDLGVPEQGESLIADMDRRLAAARAAAPSPPVTTLVYEAAGYTVAGGITDELMTAAGLVNGAPAMRPTLQSTIPLEMVAAKAPELLLFNTSVVRADSRARQILDHPALSRLPAATHRTRMSLPELLCPGPWSARAAEAFAKAARAARR